MSWAIFIFAMFARLISQLHFSLATFAIYEVNNVGMGNARVTQIQVGHLNSPIVGASEMSTDAIL